MVSSGGAEVRADISTRARVSSSEDAFACVFGADVVAGALERFDEACVGTRRADRESNRVATSTRCLGSAVVRCVAPPLSVGALSFWVVALPAPGYADATQTPRGNAASVFVVSAPTFFGVSPARVSADGGGVVHLAGRHVVDERIAVAVGSSSAPAALRVISSAVASFEAPAHEYGVAALLPEISGGAPNPPSRSRPGSNTSRRRG